MDEDGWVRPGYANSNFLVFMKQGEEISYVVTLMENDCIPGDETFTGDLKTELELRVFDYEEKTLTLLSIM